MPKEPQQLQRRLELRMPKELPHIVDSGPTVDLKPRRREVATKDAVDRDGGKEGDATVNAIADTDLLRPMPKSSLRLSLPRLRSR